MAKQEYISQIQSQLEAIRDETHARANTATRIGNALLALLSLVGDDGDRYLSRLNDDEALGLIRFLKGLEATSAVVGKLQSGQATIDGELNVNGTITSDNDVVKIIKRLISKEGIQFGTDFADGLTGVGGYIDGNGRGYMRSLELYESLSVPELKYNRVSVKVGCDWRAPGAGIIASVEPDKDEDGNYIASGVINLRLEDGEIGLIEADDLCMGIWHNTNGDNEAETTDDYKGNYTFAGFSTVYFRIVEITNTANNSQARYVLRNDDRWPAKMHPCTNMTFVVFGNPSNEDRRSSEYATTRYRRFLRNVTTWEYRIENIGMQFGDLENLMVYGVDMKGYSVFAQNMYLTGHIAGVDSNDCELVIYGINDTITVGENRKIDMKLMSKGYEVTDALFDISRDSGDADADAIWNESHKGLASTIYLSSDDMGEGGYVNPVMFIFTGTSQKDSAITSSTGKVIRLVTQEQMYITFSSNKGQSLQVYYDNVDIAIEARLMYGEEDITESLVTNKSDTQVVWTRDSGNINTDKAWIPTIGDKKNVLLIEDKVNGRHDCGDSWQTSLQTTFKCEITVNIGNSVMKMSADLNVGI